LLGSLVGQPESNSRAVLKLADAMAPCVLFGDRSNKALAWAISSGPTDSGVTARVFGSLLTWLNDHDSDVFFVGTCNDASKQPRPDGTNWTGAEIKSCCRLASLLNVSLVQATQNVVPVAVTAGDKIEALRQWAFGRRL
jgi:hypothetical protein